ncbi:prepilin-type N-terminal cleavage/methylation domain-containing protein [Patescibacteria group bacterium]|nr:prepilin-type N-terminal cleavage/methylation domain-containing protein [Patescibacteria group bacterium]MBU1877172.1 prepilin-type N-terminal cleavage/methylation domain-containing protein [Patescibacteria group bacterium]
MKKYLGNSLKQKGFTLTELLVVITVLILVTGIISSIFQLSQKIYRTGETVAEITQNGRVVLERMMREIRQAKEVVTELSEEEENPFNEIIFQDGHLSSIIESDLTQEASLKTIILDPSASSQNDYYEKTFIKIIDGSGVGQIREIIDYDGITKEAVIRSPWDIIPNIGSTYKIDSSYYYIRYSLSDSEVKRQVIVYCFSGDFDTYVPWNATPPQDQTIETVIIQEQVVGEYVSELSFWGLTVINVNLSLEKNDKRIDLKTKIFIRNI